MLIASGDPVNLALVITWVVGLLFCQALAIYAYVRWKKNPNNSLSHHIAEKIEGLSIAEIAGIGIVIGFVIGLITGMFAGHWFWPVEL